MSKNTQESLALINKLQSIMLTAPYEKLYSEILNELLKTTRSKYGLFGYINEDQSLVIASITNKVWDECKMENKDIVFPPSSWGGIWGQALHDKKSYFGNRKFNTPKGHIPIFNALAIPIIYHGNAIGLLTLGNREDSDYTVADKNLMDEIANYIAPILFHQIQRDRQQTELTTKTKELYETKQRLESITQSIDEGIMLLSKDLKIEWANRTFLKQTGQSLEDVLGEYCYKVTHKQDHLCTPPEHTCPIDNISTKNPSSGEIHKHFDKDNKPIYVDVRAYPIKDAMGNISQYIHLTRDITDRLLLEKEREQLLQTLNASEIKHRTLFESSADAIMTLAPPSWKFTSGNPSTVKMFKAKDLADFISRAPWEYSPKIQPCGTPSSDKAKAMIMKAMKEGSHYFEWEHMRLDGETFPATVLLNRIEIEDNVSLQGTVRDITEQVKAKEELRQSEAKFKSIFERATDGILVADIQSKHFLMANDAFKNMLGYSMDDLSQMQVYDLHPKEDLPKVLAAFEAQAAGKIIIAKDLPVLKKDGSVIYADINSFPVIIKDEAFLVGIFRDITDYKTNEEEKIKLQNQLLQSEKMASLGQIAAGVAHEINNPTGFVMSNIGTLKDYVTVFKSLFSNYDALIKAVQKNDTAAQQEIINQINEITKKEDLPFILDDIDQLLHESQDGTVRIKDIVQNLNTFARSGPPETISVNIHEGIESTLKIVWNELKYKCRIHKDYGNIPTIPGQPSELNQVWMNLLVNAAHAITEQGDIHIKTGVEDDSVYVKISDTGKGIDAKSLEHIFEPFYTTKEIGQGTGLGLSVIYGIIEKHKGKIHVSSEIGIGTVFTVWLPLNSDD